MKKEKTLIIIAGVTGPIGEACFGRLCREPDTTVIGLSRKGLSFGEFCQDNKKINSTVICSIGSDISDINVCKKFISSIDTTNMVRIVYVHSIGFYPIELDKNGKVCVQNDFDGDGIDDRVMFGSYLAFFAMVEALQETGIPVFAMKFGSIADKYKLSVHRSWWTVMDMVKKRMSEMLKLNKLLSFGILNVSSVISVLEISALRRYVFQNTNANPRFWLTPSEVAEKVVDLVSSPQDNSLFEDNLFHCADYYTPDYYKEESYTQRKRIELGIVSK